jgi:cytochrome c-type biogenesis protein
MMMMLSISDSISIIQSSSLPLSISSDFGVAIYDAQLSISKYFDPDTLATSSIGPILLYFAGLLASFSPCSLSLMPLTLVYLGTDSTSIQQQQQQQQQNEIKIFENNRITRSILYAIGLSTTLSLLGLSSALLGQLFNTAGSTIISDSPFGDVANLIAGVIALTMGFYLLELIDIQFPSIDTFLNKMNNNNNNNNDNKNTTTTPYSAFLFGATSALVASPCSSPVLASLLAIISASKNPVLGISMLFFFSLGRSTPVVLAGTLSGSINAFASGKGASWVNLVFASLLVMYGTYQTLDVVYYTFL